MLENLNAIFIDVETGGLDPKRDSLLSLGAVYIENGNPVDEREWLVRPEDKNKTVASWLALEINKIEIGKHLEEAEPYISAALSFMLKRFVYYPLNKKPFLGGHNIQFDKSFLQEQFLTKAALKHFSHRMIDTCSIARVLVDAGLIPEDAHSSQGLIDFFKIELKGQRHSALTDAWVAWDLYKAMVKMVARV